MIKIPIIIFAFILSSCSTIGFIEDVEYINKDTSWILFNYGGDLEPIYYDNSKDSVTTGMTIKVRHGKFIKILEN